MFNTQFEFDWRKVKDTDLIFGTAFRDLKQRSNSVNDIFIAETNIEYKDHFRKLHVMHVIFITFVNPNDPMKKNIRVDFQVNWTEDITNQGGAIVIMSALRYACKEFHDFKFYELTGLNNTSIQTIRFNLNLEKLEKLSRKERKMYDKFHKLCRQFGKEFAFKYGYSIEEYSMEDQKFLDERKLDPSDISGIYFILRR